MPKKRIVSNSLNIKAKKASQNNSRILTNFQKLENNLAELIPKKRSCSLRVQKGKDLEEKKLTKEREKQSN